jgi:hypothetical protein
MPFKAAPALRSWSRTALVIGRFCADWGTVVDVVVVEVVDVEAGEVVVVT